MSGGVTSTLVTLGQGLQSIGEDPTAPALPNGDAQGNQSVDFGFYRQQIGNMIWVDSNDNGVIDGTETPYTGGPITVTLLDTAGNVIDSVVTTNGVYTFTSVPAGTFVISATLPAGFVSSTPTTNTIGVDGDDSGTQNGQFVVSAPFTATPGTNAGSIVSSDTTGTTVNPSIDFGIVADLYDLGNRVWFDTNNNGTFDSGEQHVAGVTVTLQTANGLLTSVTDANGYYSFTNLTPGSYAPVIAALNFAPGAPLDGYWSSSGTGSANDDDHGIDPATRAAYVSGGVTSTLVTLGLGLQPLGEDLTAPALPNGDARGDQTADFGFYRQQIGNTIWVDSNDNGVIDGAETPYSGGPITVTLLDTAGNVIDSVVTTNGVYAFTSVPSGTFVISASLPAVFVSSTPTTNTVGVDDDDNGVQNGQFVVSAPFTATPGTNAGSIVSSDTTGTTVNPSIDFGIVADLYDLGNRVWFDTNNNGLLDAGEQPVAGVTVTLQTATGLLTSVTDASGYYQFTNLVAGTYTPTIAAANFAPGAPLEGYWSSTSAASGNNADHGIDPATRASYLADGVSGAPVTLGIGLQPTSEDLTSPALPNGDARGDQTVDFGFYRQQIGNTIWVDSNDNGVIDGAETPYTGGPITVTLLDTAGNVIDSVVTTNGVYTFTSVPSGTFVISASVPTGFISSYPTTNTLGIDGDDSGTQNGQFVVSASFAATPGTNSGSIVSSDTTGTTLNPSIDFGIVADLYDLGNRVWFDTNNNGVLDAGELPVPGVTVTLQTANGLLTSVTDANGYYSFTNLSPGSYAPVIAAANFAPGAPLDGYWSSSGTGSANDDDHGIDPASRAAYVSGGVTSTLVTLGQGLQSIGEDPTAPALPNGDAQGKQSVDFGFYRQQIGNMIWVDSNDNGVIDGAETPYSGGPITVTLLDTAGNVIDSVVTTNGVYTFTSVPAGTFVISATLPAGFVSSTPTTNTIGVDGDNSGTQDGQFVVSAPFTATPGTNAGSIVSNDTTGTTVNPSIDFGIVADVFDLGNRVWFDTNNNGTFDSGEAAVQGVTVTLQTATGLLTSVTDASGYYQFTNLVAGTYTPTIAAANFAPGAPLESFWSSTSAASGNNADHGIDPATRASYLADGVSGAAVTLGIGLQPTSEDLTSPALPNGDARGDQTVDFGFYRQQIGNTIWVDSNDNGVIDGAETPYTGGPITVTLLDTAGNVIDSVVTTNGVYTFTSVPSGTFVISASVPTGFISSYPTTNTLGIDGDDSGTQNGQFLVSAPFTATPGTNTGVIASDGATGTTANPSIDFGIVTDLYDLGNRVWFDTNNNGVLDSGEQPVAGVTVTLQTANGLLTSVTDANGYYSFTNLTPGSYAPVIAAANFAPGAPLDGYWSSSGTGSANDDDHGIDPASRAAYVSGGVTSTLVTLGQGLQSIGEDPTAPALPNGDAQGKQSVDFGFYRQQIGNTIWVDGNDNGVIDGTETPYTGGPITVTLLDAAGNVIDSVVTTNGVYTFTSVPAGTFVISATLPAGFVSSGTTTTTAGIDDNDDGAANGQFVVSAPFTATPGTNAGSIVFSDTTGTTVNPSIDFGIVPNAYDLGNRVWFDTNNNGSFDSGEAAVQGVTVTLQTATGLLTSVTDANGYYAFTSLPAGVYTPIVAGENFAPGAPLDGYWSSTGAATGNNADHGIDPADRAAYLADGVAMAPMTLGQGQQPFGEDPDAPTLPNGDGRGNQTADFGFYTQSVGNTVWQDLNNNGIQEPGEPGMPGITVTLYAADGSTALDVMTTDANGVYTFTGVPSGTYVIGVTPGPGMLSSLGAGGEDDPNSNIDATQALISDNGVQLAGGEIKSNPVALTPGNAGTLNNTVVSALSGSTANPTLDFGLFAPATLGNTVWEDLNHDGVQDPNEPGVPDVVVVLQTPAGVLTTTTDANGLYTFTNLVSGTFQVTFVPPAGYTFTVQGTNPASDTDSNANPLTGVTAQVVLNAGDSNPTIDAGLWRPASLGDLVWVDRDRDGVQDAGEAGLNGVLVTLLNDAGEVVSTTTTASIGGLDGAYTFTQLISDTYHVSFTLPSGYTATVPNTATNTFDATDSDGIALGAAAVTGDYPLYPGQSIPTVDQGVWKPLSLGNLVWEDVNNNGTVDGGETGIDGVTVNLYADADGNGVPEGAALQSMSTSNGGHYLFTNLPEGKYVVEIVPPAGMTGSTGTPSSPTGPYEPGIAEDNTASGDNGDHGTAVGAVIRSGTIMLTNDIEPMGETDAVLPSGAVNAATDANTQLTVDFGLFKPAMLGDRVWYDTDYNGAQDGAENGVPNVTVILIDALTSTPLYTTTTDGNGIYTFTNLISGTYAVQFVTSTLPSNYILSPQNDPTAGDAADSDANPNTGLSDPVTLGYGEVVATLDAGIHRPDSGLGDRVWEDLNHDGFQDINEPGIPSVSVTLWQNGVPLTTTQTDASGYYSFTQLVPGTYSVTFGTPAGYLPTLQTGAIGDAGNSDADPLTGGTANVTLPANTFNPNIDAGFWRPASLGDVVWEDFNHDGVQNDGSTGVNDVLVTLLNDAGQIVSTTTTFTGGPDNAPGYYTFTNLISDTYLVSFTLPTGYQFTLDNVSNDGMDSDASPLTGVSGLVVVNAGESVPTMDAGIWQPASLGNYVWVDINHDGVQENSEPAVPGVQVTLFDGASGMITSTTTNSAGWYSFTDLISNTYHVEFNLATLPDGYAPTVRGPLGVKDATDSDPDVAGTTEITALAAGENDPSWDMGIWKPATLGDSVWEDLNHDGVQDPNEPGVPGVLVTLVTPTGTLTTTTDAAGNYTFTNLISGTYGVQFTPPAGYTFTVPGLNPGGTNGADSNVITPDGATPPIVLNIGDANPTIDAGIWRPATLGDYVWEDLNHDGRQDANEPPLSGVIVTLQTPTGTLQTTTSITGYFEFTGLVSGVPLTVTFAQPGGYLPTAQNGALSDPGNSDANPLTGQAVVTLQPGENNPDIDAGFWRPGGIGDSVWLDVDRDGEQDAGEPPVAGVVVTLQTPQGVLTATTSITGYYSFEELVSAQPYTLTFGLPNGVHLDGADGHSGQPGQQRRATGWQRARDNANTGREESERGRRFVDRAQAWHRQELA